MKILVTGGLGFIGSNVIKELSKNHTIDVVDGFSLDYVGYKYIHRGTRGLDKINEIESKHRELNLKYRLSLLRGNIRNLYKNWSFEELPTEEYDLIINLGALSEAILSQYFKEFTTNSIYNGIKNIKYVFKSTPVLHISSSMVYGTWEEQIDERYSLGPVDHYGHEKLKAEKVCSDNDVILRPIHVYGMGDGKFSIWMNIERQIKANKPLMVENASCIYIDDFVLAIKNIIDNWQPGVYNISYDFLRNAEDIQKVYPGPIQTKNKLGPTGKPRGSLNCTKLKEVFSVNFNYNTYYDTLKDYYNKYENFCKK